jgi:hypothetical protein
MNMRDECVRLGCVITTRPCAPECSCGGTLTVTRHRHADNSFRDFNSPNWVEESFLHGSLGDSIDHDSPEAERGSVAANKETLFL